MDLFEALTFRDLEQVASEIAATADLNERLPGTLRTPLTMALYLEYEPAVTLLLESGADPNRRDACSAPPFAFSPFYLALLKDLLQSVTDMVRFNVAQSDIEDSLLFSQSKVD